MTRRNRQDLAPSLFPFLAVLVCTLGTLILLLALLAESSATAAEQKAREEISQKMIELAPDSNLPSQSQAAAMIDEAEFHIDAIESIRDKQAALLEERRDQLTHLENHIGRLEKELWRLNSEMQNATGGGETDQIDSETIAMLRDQITKEQLAIEQLKKESGNQTPRVVIVPHKGPNGTTRRPIYVECTSAGLTIWPEGVIISTDQLVGRRTRLANPLDAALRVARLHIMKVYGDTDPPYPLLVVRPHGTDAYFQATAAMDDWDDQYGYEMLDSDIELAFSSPDPNLKRRMEEAVQQALARQADRRTTRAVTLSASELARNGQSLGFYERPNHGYGNGSGGATDFDQQTNRLNDIYRDAAQELRSRDGKVGESGSGSQTGSHFSGQSADQPGAGFGDQVESQTSDQKSLTASSDPAAAAGPNQPGVNQPGASQPGASQPGASQPGASQPGANQSGPSQSQGAKSAQTNQTGSPSVTADATEQNPGQRESSQDSSANPSSATVHRDGDNWALPTSVAQATGIAIVRSIPVQLYDDRFVVPASRNERRTEIPFNGNLDRASLELATVLRERIRALGSCSGQRALGTSVGSRSHGWRKSATGPTKTATGW